MDDLVIIVVLLAAWFAALFLASYFKGKFAPRIGLLLLVCGFIVGAGTFLFASYLEINWYLTGIVISEIEGTVLVFPIIEEFSKILFILVLFLLLAFTPFSPKNKSRPYLMLLGASIGLGFAFTKSLIQGSAFSILRGFTIWPIHILAATILAVGIAVALSMRNRRGVLRVLIAIGLAIVIHGAFNYFVILTGLR